MPICECRRRNQQPRRLRRGCCSHKVVAVGFNTFCYDAERRGIKASARIKNFAPNALSIHYPYNSDIRDISHLIREYIDTPKTELMNKHFENDYWGLINILKAADKRIGYRRLEILRKKTGNRAAQKVIAARAHIKK